MTAMPLFHRARFPGQLCSVRGRICAASSDHRRLISGNHLKGEATIISSDGDSSR
jgi:hypothetical protein